MHVIKEVSELVLSKFVTLLKSVRKSLMTSAFPTEANIFNSQQFRRIHFVHTLLHFPTLPSPMESSGKFNEIRSTGYREFLILRTIC